jgi:hypothetical protein
MSDTLGKGSGNSSPAPAGGFALAACSGDGSAGGRSSWGVAVTVVPT